MVIKQMKSNKKWQEKTNETIWLIVHDMCAYEENSRLIGFGEKVYNAKKIKPKDKIVYYFSGSSTLKGIYEVCDKPWKRDSRWVSEYQIQIEPILELNKSIDFKEIVSKLKLFEGKSRWQGCIQGINAVRELSQNDFNIIEESIYLACIENNESDYRELLEEDKSIVNESQEVKINRMKRNQQIISKLKTKYNNCCQIEGCNFSFIKKNGERYSEAHHLEMLSKGGSQAENNVVVLCANHHRMFHYADVQVFEKIGDKRKVLINGEENYIIYKNK